MAAPSRPERKGVHPRDVPWSGKEAPAGVPKRVLLSFQPPTHRGTVVQQIAKRLRQFPDHYLRETGVACGNLRGEIDIFMMIYMEKTS